MTPLLVYSLLAAAIFAEVVATTALARSESFSRLGPSLVAILGYGAAFYLLSFPLRVMPTGIVYALWSGAGILCVAAIGWIWYGQTLDLPALLGLGLIVAGVLVVNLFSETMPH